MRILRFANLTLGGAACLCLALLCYLIAQNGWAPSLLLLMVLSGACLASLYLKPSLKINLVLVLCSTVLATYTGELVLSAGKASHLVETETRWLPSPAGEEWAVERARVARQFGTVFDTRSRLEVIRDLGRQGIPAYPAMFSQALFTQDEAGALRSAIIFNGAEALPLGGIANVVTVQCNENGDYTIYDSDEHGFHNPKGLWQANRIKIIALGDSFTRGACVPTGKEFVALIRARHTATVNLGIDGNGPLTMLATLKEYGPFLKPKLALWFYYEGNDLDDLRLEQQSPLLRQYLAGDFNQGLLAKQAEIDQALIIFAETIKRSRTLWGRINTLVRQPQSLTSLSTTLKQIISLSLLRWTLGYIFQHIFGENTEETFPPVRATDRDLALFGKVLQSADAFVRAWDGKLVFVYLPQWHRYSAPATASVDRDRVLALVNRLGMPLVDLHPVFAAHEDPLALFPFRQWGHYNVAGHRVVANAVMQYIKDSHVSADSARTTPHDGKREGLLKTTNVGLFKP